MTVDFDPNWDAQESGGQMHIMGAGGGQGGNQQQGKSSSLQSSTSQGNVPGVEAGEVVLGTTDELPDSVTAGGGPVDRLVAESPLSWREMQLAIDAASLLLFALFVFVTVRSD